MEKSDFVMNYPALHIEIKQDGIREATANDIAEMHPEYVKAWKQEGLRDERERSAEIRDSAFPGQETLIEELIRSDVSADDARKRLIADQKNRTEEKLEKIIKNDVGDLGANPAEQETAKPVVIAKTKQEAGNKLDEIAKAFVKSEGLNYSAAFNKAKQENQELVKVYQGRE